MENLKEMLIKAAKIVQKHEEEARKNGENFNLFSILDRESDEVKTHSALIAELLNPNGSHGQGNIFLKHFIDLLWDKKEETKWKNAKIPNKEELTDTQVYVERNVGIYRDKDSWLDILIANRNYQICIENKFYADNQEKQLERYSDYLNEDSSRKIMLIYLTRDGKDYPDNDEMKNGDNYFCLSYTKDILNWINSCLKDCEKIPLVKETFNQYKTIIEKHTNQSTNYKMKNEIQQLIMSNGIKGARKIATEYHNVFSSLSTELREKVLRELKKSHPKSFSRSKPFSSIFIPIDKDLWVGIEGFNRESHDDHSLYVGKLNFNRKKEETNKYWKYYWYPDGREIFWNKTQLLDKLDEYGRNEDKRDDIAQEIVDYVQNYIERITHK